MRNVGLSLVGVVLFTSNLANAFEINNDLINECLELRNFSNNEYTKTSCIVVTKTDFNFEELTMTSFDGTCEVVLVNDGQNTEITFVKNPNRQDYSTHMTSKEVKNCLLSF